MSDIGQIKDRTQILPTDLVAKCCRASIDSVAVAWPLIIKALQDAGICSPLVQIAVAATVAVETGGTFRPIREKMAKPHTQPDLYSRQMQYFPWIGRGYVQITWQSNYRLYGSLAGVDLIQTPDMACDPVNAARVLAAFFRHNGIDKAAEAQDWRKVRKIINGGYNGWDAFNGCVCALLEAVGA